MMKTNGRVFKYGSNVDTDVIIPARYLSTFDPGELAKHCMEDLDSTFSSQVKSGDIIVGEKNFGCGSSREHAPLAIKASGISCVIASSFARIFYRNAINIGLPILECPEAVEKIENGDVIEINFKKGIIHNMTKTEFYEAQPFPEFIQKIMESDGLIKYIAKGLAQQKSGGE
ncbi:3-isopropylmalate dehydratase, small subunit [Alkaliphilus metalliredigens QYMF]|uniref:3-isopropylmalate dehydratase small subunit n=2 Tax=Alkaliphilus TaxID=114627 RepID=A6TTR6_ALKMQ|nr:3-isopropylmalate dehydratase small subunit [Alkaliphilus metalliredigens]ABR49584.1 3-isopropylmalate dehydratase, small subunit [Alkaliphilus metalliredigens QYMF]